MLTRPRGGRVYMRHDVYLLTTGLYAAQSLKARELRQAQPLVAEPGGAASAASAASAATGVQQAVRHKVRGRQARGMGKARAKMGAGTGAVFLGWSEVEAKKPKARAKAKAGTEAKEEAMINGIEAQLERLERLMSTPLAAFTTPWQQMQNSTAMLMLTPPAAPAEASAARVQAQHRGNLARNKQKRRQQACTCVHILLHAYSVPRLCRLLLPCKHITVPCGHDGCTRTNTKLHADTTHANGTCEPC